jgi:hypothetical protein
VGLPTDTKTDTKLVGINTLTDTDLCQSPPPSNTQDNFLTHFALLRPGAGFMGMNQREGAFEDNPEFARVNQVCDLLQLRSVRPGEHYLILPDEAYDWSGDQPEKVRVN